MLDKISVIISAWNNDKYLEECLDSVYNQSLDKNLYEVLLGIDGCEKTLNKALEIKDKYVDMQFSILNMKENRGTYVTCNTLILNSNYSIICRFDSDDIMKPNMLRTIYDSFQVQGISIVKFGGVSFKEDLNNIETPSESRFFDGVLSYRREVFNKLGSYKDWRCAADTDFLYRLTSLIFKELDIKQILYYRRIHPSSLTRCVETGFKSDLRRQYAKQLRRKYEYVIPITNTFNIPHSNIEIRDNIVNDNLSNVITIITVINNRSDIRLFDNRINTIKNTYKTHKFDECVIMYKKSEYKSLINLKIKNCIVIKYDNDLFYNLDKNIKTKYIVFNISGKDIDIHDKTDITKII